MSDFHVSHSVGSVPNLDDYLPFERIPSNFGKFIVLVVTIAMDIDSGISGYFFVLLQFVDNLLYSCFCIHIIYDLVLEKQPVFKPIASWKLGLFDETDTVRVEFNSILRIRTGKSVAIDIRNFFAQSGAHKVVERINYISLRIVSEV